MVLIFRKFENELYKKIAKAGVINILITIHSINSSNYATAYHQTLEEVPRTLVPGK